VIFLAHTVGGREIYAWAARGGRAFSGLSVGAISCRLRDLCLRGHRGPALRGLLPVREHRHWRGLRALGHRPPRSWARQPHGGRGTALGALLGALVIKLIENGIDILRAINLGLFTLPVSKEYGQIIIGVAILLAVAVDRLSETIAVRRGGPG